MRFRIIEDCCGEYPVRVLCDTLGVSPSSHCAWRTRPERERKAANRQLLADIQRLHDHHRKRDGASRIHAAVRAQGRIVSRKAVGWAMGDHLRTELPLAALTMAIQRRYPAPGLLHHCDRGSQYASAEYRKALKDHGIVQSMSRKGNGWDNAPMESFFGTAKSELVHLQRCPTREAAKRDLFTYNYNRQRLHSALGYITPQQAELRAA